MIAFRKFIYSLSFCARKWSVVRTVAHTRPWSKS